LQWFRAVFLATTSCSIALGGYRCRAGGDSNYTVVPGQAAVAADPHHCVLPLAVHLRSCGAGVWQLIGLKECAPAVGARVSTYTGLELQLIISFRFLSFLVCKHEQNSAGNLFLLPLEQQQQK